MTVGVGTLRVRLWLLSAAWAWLLLPGTASAACKVSYFAQIPVRLDGGEARTTAMVNGHSVDFLVSNLAFYSSMSDELARSIGFVAKPASNAYIVSTKKGSIKTAIGVAEELKFGSQAISAASFLVFSGSNQPSSAFIGQNILALRDTEYNLGQGLIRLTRPLDRGCTGKDLAYWAGSAPVATVPLELPEGYNIQMRGSVMVDGIPMTAIFDINGEANLISPSALGRLPHAGVKATDSDISVQTLDIGGEVTRDVRFAASPEDMVMDEKGYDLRIGRPFFMTHRIYVSPSRKALFFTRNDAAAVAGKP